MQPLSMPLCLLYASEFRVQSLSSLSSLPSGAARLQGVTRRATRQAERRAERRPTGRSSSVPGASKQARASRRRSRCGLSESRDTASTPSGSTRILGFAPSPTAQVRSGPHCLRRRRGSSSARAASRLRRALDRKTCLPRRCRSRCAATRSRRTLSTSLIFEHSNCGSEGSSPTTRHPRQHPRQRRTPLRQQTCRWRRLSGPSWSSRRPSQPSGLSTPTLSCRHVGLHRTPCCLMSPPACNPQLRSPSITHAGGQ